MRSRVPGLPAMLALVGIACGEQPPATEVLPLTALPLPAGFAQTVGELAPEDNALTEPRAQLGKRLFFDPILSRDQSVSCGSCHLQEHGFADPNPRSEGIGGQVGKRNAPHLVNLAWVRTGLFWDGRAATLEEQVLQPIQDPLEMDLTLPEAIARLQGQQPYVTLFAQAYDVDQPSAETLAKALASFIRTLVSANSPYDRFLAGDEQALTTAAQKGLELFLGERTGCFHCHSADTLTNDGFFNNGSYRTGGDIGRQAQSGLSGDLGKFRVPSLRNVAVTGPYLHDGSLGSLEEVVEHYQSGGSGHRSTDSQIEPLDLGAEEKAALVAFLESLTDTAFLSDPRYRP